MSLIKEINDLRQELRVANTQVHNLESTLRLNKSKKAIQDTGEWLLYIFLYISCILSVLLAEALLVLGKQFYYCLYFILTCLPDGTWYILMFIVEAAKSCRFLLFRSTPSALKDAFLCSCPRTVWAGPLLLCYVLSVLSSSSLRWTSIQPSCPEVESRDGKWKNHRNAAARNSISARSNPGDGEDPELSRFSLFQSEIFLTWIWEEATRHSNTDSGSRMPYIIISSWQDQKCNSIE